MEIHFSDPTAIPLPPQSIRILTLAASRHADGRRVKVLIELTPFQQRPSGEIRISNTRGETLAEISLIEMIEPRQELTLHLHGDREQSPLQLEAAIYYLLEPDAAAQGEPAAWQKPSPLHQKQILF